MVKSYNEVIGEISLFLNSLNENAKLSTKQEENELDKMSKDKNYPANMNEYSRNLCRKGCLHQIEENKKSEQLTRRLLIALDVITNKDFDT